MGMSNIVQVVELGRANTGSMYDDRGCFVYVYRLSVCLSNLL
jgi:hypothetical protein